MAKKNRGLKAYTRPDTLIDVQDSDLVQKSQRLLEAIIISTKALEPKRLDEHGLRERKVVLGYLNAANNIIKTKMQFFRMINIEAKVQAVQKAAKIVG